MKPETHELPEGFAFEPHERCGSCKYCEHLKGAGLGYCRRYAPRAHQSYSIGTHSDARPFAAFPVVQLTRDWCGEHVALNIPRI